MKRVFFEEEVLAVEHNVGELPYPVADDHHPRLARKHQVKLYVAVTVDEVVDVRVGLHVLLGVAHEGLLVLALVRRLLPVDAFQAAVLGPCQPEPHSPPRMHGAE